MYEYSQSGSTWDGSAAVYERIFKILESLPGGSRVLDAGCGNGHLAALLAGRFECVGVDPSATGIAVAKVAHPSVHFACSDLTHGTGDLIPGSFDAVACIEVIEHVYAPRLLLLTLFQLLKPGGKLILTTPYHGYAKNLAVILTGRFDRHFNPLWDHGHIKFFSRNTLREIVGGAGFVDVEIGGIGRMPYLWKSMVVVAVRPPDRQGP